MTDSLWNYRFDIRSTEEGIEVLPMGTGLPEGWLASVYPDRVKISPAGERYGLTPVSARMLVSAAIAGPEEAS